MLWMTRNRFGHGLSGRRWQPAAVPGPPTSSKQICVQAERPGARSNAKDN